jgi:PD-(D/E)XK nuclease superfamily
MSSENHETKGHEMHEQDTVDDGSNPRYRMRLPSPLSEETETLVTRVIGCAIRVHTALGPGFLESIYKKAMAIELKAEGLSYLRTTGIRVGLLINFRVAILPHGLRRVVL